MATCTQVSILPCGPIGDHTLDLQELFLGVVPPDDGEPQPPGRLDEVRPQELPAQFRRVASERVGRNLVRRLVAAPMT